MQTLRWASPATAAVYFELRDLAPLLSGLLYSQTIPDSTLQVILDWSEAIAAPDAGSTLDLDRLRTIFPALVVAFVAGHTYARADPGENGGDCIDLYDQGCGTLVATVMALAAAITIALHGDEGQRLVVAAHADLKCHLTRITKMIAGR